MIVCSCYSHLCFQVRGELVEIALAVGAVINRYKMAKHFDLDITDAGFSFTRKAAERPI